MDKKESRKNIMQKSECRKWLILPIGILLTLWLSKSILFALVIGFGITFFLDRQSTKLEGLNRLAVLSLLYIIGFSIFIAVILKTTDPHSGVFYYIGENELFFDKYTYIYLLRDGILRGL